MQSNKDAYKTTLIDYNLHKCEWRSEYEDYILMLKCFESLQKYKHYKSIDGLKID